MKSFNLLDRLFGRQDEPFVPGAHLSALSSKMEAGQCWIVPEGAVVVPSPPEPKYPEAERIAASIRDFPEDWGWARKGYDLVHVPSGFKLWVANEDYGIAEVHPNNGATFFSKPEQSIIWPAVEGWLARHKVGFTDLPVKPRITPLEGRFYCKLSEHQWRGVGRTAGEAYCSWLAAVSMKARAQLPKGEVLTV